MIDRIKSGQSARIRFLS